jgi:DNA polymerase
MMVEMTTAELVVNYLRTLQVAGTQLLPVDENARAILREWMLAARRGVRPPAPQVMPPQQSPVMPQPAQPVAAQSTAPEPPQDAAAMANYLRAAVHEENTPAPTPEMEEEAVPYFRPGGSTPDEVWGNFERMLPTWRPLKELGTLRNTLVPPMGNRTADIMFVGDAPTYPDECEQRTFAGAAGEKLDGMLRAMGLSRDQVYITHLVKFRPAMPRQTTNNRPPSEREILFSRSIVELEVRLVRPRVIVALGVIAARGLLQLGELPLAAYQQQGGLFCGVPVVVSHHHSYLLRTHDLTERRRLWEEMLKVMEMTNLPITEKQRGYFLKK